MDKLKKIICICIVSIYLFSPSSIFAANVSLQSNISNMEVGDSLEVGFFIDTQGEDINALEGKIIISENKLKLKEIKDGNSIVNFWIERPKEKNGEVTFSGIIPGGYNDSKGLIFSLVFEAYGEEQNSINVENIKVLKNDGQGTTINTNISNFSYSVSGESSSAKFVSEKKDIEQPENFVPEIAKDENLFDGKNFIVFATQDKNSGIDHYEIKETRLLKIGKLSFENNSDWIIVDSPYVLKDQSLKSIVYVKAIDRSANERIVKLDPEYSNQWYKEIYFWSILIIMILVFTFLGNFLWKRLR